MEWRSQDCIFPREIQKVTGADVDFDLVKMAQDFCWVLGVGASTVSSLPPAPFLREVIPPGLCSCSHSQHSCTWSEKVPVLTCLEKKKQTMHLTVKELLWPARWLPAQRCVPPSGMARVQSLRLKCRKEVVLWLPHTYVHKMNKWMSNEHNKEIRVLGRKPKKRSNN